MIDAFQRQLAIETRQVSGVEWRRILVGAGDEPCPFGCTYCFSRFAQYHRGGHIDDLIAALPNVPFADFLYPDCDGDLFAAPNWRAVLKTLKALPYSVSLSTKAHLRSDQVGDSVALQHHLLRRGRFLKIGVSLSTKYSVSEVEPNTPRYDMRLDSLRLLHESGLPNSLVLRPLLPEVSNHEYLEILEDARSFTERILVGEEWLDERAPRPALRSPLRDVRTASQPVGWLAGSPQWTKRHTVGRVAELRKLALARGYMFFESDIALMADISNGYKARGADELHS